ncbi:FecR domain-containing protein, partial [Pseudomonas sp. SIMBA_044]|uniref:FecR domain-containing protein n=1 Tax=Pseudomonas sp. SIMBA_044 TaxID=3085785 RepID=UPI00397D3873
MESIAFQPNTMAAITTKPAGFFAPRKTEIVQQVGALDLEIEKRSQPHTTVQTPYLAAVVKGTIFHVSVAKSKASVSVDRGLVQVT